VKVARRPTFTGDWPIPKRILLPGVRVRVKVVPPGERAVLNGCDGASVYSHEKDTCTILIDGALPLPIQRYTLLHELEHVTNELRDVMLEHYAEHVRTRWMHRQFEPGWEEVVA
jgi:hypothetical protein